MSIFEQSLSDFHKLCNSTFHLIVVNKLIQVILVSVGGIMVSIAAFQAVDPGSIPGRRICFKFFCSPIILGCELEGLWMVSLCPWEFSLLEPDRNVGPLLC